MSESIVGIAGGTSGYASSWIPIASLAGSTSALQWGGFTSPGAGSFVADPVMEGIGRAYGMAAETPSAPLAIRVPLPRAASSNVLSQAEQRAMSKIDNAIRDHLKPHDLTGSLRDALGNPVPKPGGGFWDRVKKMNDTLRGLRNNSEKLKNSTDPAARAAYQKALDAIRQIEEHAKGAGL